MTVRTSNSSIKNALHRPAAKMVAAIVIASLVAYPLAVTRSSASQNNLESSDLSTTAASSLDSNAEVITQKSPASEKKTNVVTELPKGYSVSNVEGEVEITVQPKTTISRSNESSVKTYVSTGEETITQGTTTVEYNDPESDQPTTIIKGGNKSTNKSSNVSIQISGSNDNSSQSNNDIEIENKTKIKIRGDSP